MEKKNIKFGLNKSKNITSLRLPDKKKPVFKFDNRQFESIRTLTKNKVVIRNPKSNKIEFQRVIRGGEPELININIERI